MATQPVVPQEKQDSIATIPDETGIGFQSAAAFKLLQRVGQMYSVCPMAPDSYKGNVSSCAIAAYMAHRMGADPLMVMQNLYLVHNRPGWSAKFLIATCNASGDFTKLRYEWKGTEHKDEWGCRAYATEKATGEVLYGPWITWKMVQAEGWLKKAGSKWATIPELMFMYRAGAWFINTICPEISMGMRTVEELEDIGAALDVTASGSVIERVVNEAPSTLDAIVEAEKAQKEAVPLPKPKPSKPEPKPLENPNYAEGSDPDPFTGTDLFDKGGK